MLSPRLIPTAAATTPSAVSSTAPKNSSTSACCSSPSDYFSVSRGSSVASSSPGTASAGGGALFTSTPLPFYTPAAAEHYYRLPETPYFTPRLPPPTPLLLNRHQHHHNYSQQVPSSRMGRPLNSPAAATAAGSTGAVVATAGGFAQGVHTSNANTNTSSSIGNQYANRNTADISTIRSSNQPVPMDLDDPSAANPPPPPPPPPQINSVANAASVAPSSLQPVPRNLANPNAARPASIAGGMCSPLTTGRSPAPPQNPARDGGGSSSDTGSSGGMRVFNPGHLAGLLRTQPSSSITNGPSHIHAHSVLALDMRPFQQYSQHRVLSSVNVSIPTTLLKRPAFTPLKMFGSLSSDHAKEVLKDWTNYANIVVFDNDSTVATDASPIKLLVGKLQLHANPDTRIGWLPGGFSAFKEAHPDLCDSSPPPKGSEGIGPAANGNKTAVQAMCLSELAGPLTAPSALGALGAGRPSLLQPTYAAHTSVSNINSSDTLIGGIDVDNRALLPRFLREMMESGNVKGQIEEKFAAIEAAEKKRLDCSFRARSRTDPFSVSDALEGGATRNRYNNIWPFNHNRVRLAVRKENPSFAASAQALMSPPPPPNTSPNPHNAEAQTLSNDYINASHIMSPAGHRRYIATQGPIESTFDDFWRMSWQEKSRVILMLVADADVQSGSQTCHKYWPDPGTSQEFGRVRVTHTAERRVPFERVLDVNVGGGVMLREFVVVVDADESTARTIWQVQYLGWPDHGVPKHADEMLQVHHLVSKLCAVLDRTYGKEDVGPVVVHCSAGCGRTGAFICIDAVLSALHTLGSLPSVSSLGTPTSPNPSPASGVSIMNLGNAFGTPAAAVSKHSGILPSQPLPPQSQALASAASSSSSSSHQHHYQHHHHSTTASRSAPGTPGASGGGGPAAGSPADTWSTVRAILTPNTFAPASSPHDMILAAVHHLRSQRVLMVQSLSQYAFCYEVVARCCAVAGIAAASPLGESDSDSSCATPAFEKSHSSLLSGRTSTTTTSSTADARESVTRYTRIVRSKAVDETLAAFPTLAYQARNPKVNVRLPQSHAGGAGGGGGGGGGGPGGRALSGGDYDETDDRKRERAASLEEMTSGMQRTLKRV